jgi:hypothetical protein
MITQEKGVSCLLTINILLKIMTITNIIKVTSIRYVITDGTLNVSIRNCETTGITKTKNSIISERLLFLI